MKNAPTIVLSDIERSTLARWSRGRGTPLRRVTRARIVLLAAEEKRHPRFHVHFTPTASSWLNRAVLQNPPTE